MPAYSATQVRKLFVRQKLLRPFLVAALATILGALAGAVVKNTNVFAQADQKKVSLGAGEKLNEQVRFSNLIVSGTAKGFEDSFRENRGWIARTSFQVENISNHEIISLHLSIVFPETKATGRMMAYTFSLGNHPGSKIQTAKPLQLAKGEKLTINLADYYERIADFVGKEYALDDISQIDLEPSFIFFSDGTAWRSGAFMRQDPKNPKRWVPIEMPGYVPTKPWNKEDKP